MEPRNPNTNTTTTINQSENTQRRSTKIGGATPVSSACAACKYQRKKCSSDCVLAPYFPSHFQTQFLNVHKLFGVSNILKTIRNLNDPLDKEQAIRSMIFHAQVRADDPVGGCYKLVCDLQNKIQQYEDELRFVLNQLYIYRASSSSSSFSSALNVYSSPMNHSMIMQQIHNNDLEHQEHHNGNDDLVLNQIWNMESVGNENQEGVVNMVMNPIPSLMNDKQEQEEKGEELEVVDRDVR